MLNYLFRFMRRWLFVQVVTATGADAIVADAAVVPRMLVHDIHTGLLLN